MLHTLHNKIQRVSDLITEYDEDLHRNPNPALHDFVEKLKVILNANNGITKKVGTNYFHSDKGRNNVSASLPSASHIDVGDSNNNPNPKVIEALGNHVVLTEIFKCGSVRDLNNFRLINKQWKGVGNSAIIQRQLWNLSINEKFSAFRSNRNEALSELNECIEASGGSFPLTTLDFSNVDDYNFLKSSSFLRFYALMGQSIKHVKFNDFGPLTINEFQDLLVNKMPNVEHIDAGNICFRNQEEYSAAPIVLPYLKTIRFIPHYDDEYDEGLQFPPPPYYKDLLLAATNLKEILDFHIYLTDTVLQTGKLDCIQTFNVDSQLVSYSDMCIKFSVSKPKLMTVRIIRAYFDEDDDAEDFVLSPVLALSLKLILISSKDTLKHFQCAPFVLPSNFELPKFPNLEFLTVMHEAYDLGTDRLDRLAQVFPAGCDCSEIFPNVHTVTLDTGSGSLNKYFPGQEFPSVKTLTFLNNFQLGSSLETIFPNVSHIKIIDFERAIAISQREELIFKTGFCPKLDNQIESLEFHQCLVGRSGREFELDSLFTGVPIHVCRKLLGVNLDCKARNVDENITFVREILEVVQIQNYKFRNSKGLRRLKIIFNHEDNVRFRISEDYNSDWDSEDGSDPVDVESYCAVISPVSCVYGFSLMPNLEQVIIGYDHYLPNASHIAQVFKPFAQFPYIKIVHEPT